MSEVPSQFADLIDQINARPELYASSSPQDLWTDPHISAQMLAFHLDPDVARSSGTAASVERAVGWMVERFDLCAGRRVVDLGCGPGLYANRLAVSGAEVIGVDFSARSLHYATMQAAEAGVSTEFIEGDYLEVKLPRDCDLVVMVMWDFGVLERRHRAGLLSNVASAIRPDGRFLFDVRSVGALEARREFAIHSQNMMAGFWAPTSYYGFHNAYIYRDEMVSLDKFEIFVGEHRSVYLNWLSHFDLAALERELDAAGFEVEDVVGNVCGERFDPASDEFAVVTRIKTGRGVS